MTRVLTAETTLDEEGYLNYSMLFMSTTYTVVYALSFTLSTAAIVHTILYNGKDIYLKFRNAQTEMEDVHAKLMRNYPEVPNWWYWAIFVVFAGIGIATIEVSVQPPIVSCNPVSDSCRRLIHVFYSCMRHNSQFTCTC